MNGPFSPAPLSTAEPWKPIPVGDVSIQLTADGHDFEISWTEPGKTASAPRRQRTEMVYEREPTDPHLGDVLYDRRLKLRLYGFTKRDGTPDGGGPNRHLRVVFEIQDEKGLPVQQWSFHRSTPTAGFLAYVEGARTAQVA